MGRRRTLRRFQRRASRYWVWELIAGSPGEREDRAYRVGDMHSVPIRTSVHGRRSLVLDVQVSDFVCLGNAGVLVW